MKDSSFDALISNRTRARVCVVKEMNKIEAVQLRADLIDGMFDLTPEDKTFMNLVRTSLSEATQSIVAGAPAHCDVGRIIAGIDAIQSAKDVLCAAVILGREADNRKKRKSAPPPPPVQQSQQHAERDSDSDEKEAPKKSKK